MIAAADEVDDFQPVAIGQRGIGQRRTWHDFAVAFNRNLFRGKLQLAHQIGNRGGVGAAWIAVQRDGLGIVHGARHRHLRQRCNSEFAQSLSARRAG